MRISDWSSDVCSSDLLRLPTTKPRQRIASAASRPGYAESRPWMACGGESGMDACRAEEHAPVGTTLCPKPALRPPAWIFTSLNWATHMFLMCAASKNDATRHFLSDSRALHGNRIFPESTSLSSQTDKSCRKVPQLDAQNPSGEYRGVQLRFGARSAALLSGNHLPWERRFPGMASKYRSRHQPIDRPAASRAASVLFAIKLVGEWIQ